MQNEKSARDRLFPTFPGPAMDAFAGQLATSLASAGICQDMLASAGIDPNKLMTEMWELVKCGEQGRAVARLAAVVQACAPASAVPAAAAQNPAPPGPASAAPVPELVAPPAAASAAPAATTAPASAAHAVPEVVAPTAPASAVPVGAALEPARAGLPAAGMPDTPSCMAVVKGARRWMRRPAASAAAAATDSQSAAEDSQATRMEMADVRAAFMDAMSHAASFEAISAEFLSTWTPTHASRPRHSRWLRPSSSPPLRSMCT